ncbi:universal stress protein [Streptomyces polygonati]|uniref:Universal stress protein n=1 Tax=Streptomyces polygonati TaxID=1617087 RepID=A0ABV8HQH8_9ACTN
MTGRPVVVGMDGSTVAFGALDVAAAEALRRRAPLEIVYCVPEPDIGGPVLAAAGARVRQRYPGLTVRTEAAVGDPVEVLVERGRDAALTVVGHRAARPFTGLLVRSVSRRMAARTLGPLLVVRGDLPQHGAGRGEHQVLLGLEHDDATDCAGYAFADADRRQVALRVTALRGTSARAVVDATAGADAIVIGTRHRRDRPGPRLGRVTSALLDHAHCPVVLVPAPTARAAVATRGPDGTGRRHRPDRGSPGGGAFRAPRGPRGMPGEPRQA